MERKILERWAADETFEASVEARPPESEGGSQYVFNDGPPFANGLPHYGHLLTGYVKDVIPRYQTMRGNRVERRFGWDCHGLPAEMETEKEIGVAVIDIGGGTTDILLYVDGGIAHVGVIPVGGNNVTADIAAGLRTPMGEAERIKRNDGCALGRMVADDEDIEVPGVGGHPSRNVPRRVLCDIIEPRIEEIFAVIRTRIEDTGLLEQLAAGAVLTGGGVLMEGMTEFAEEILGMPVRLGVPIGVRGITQLVAGPQYATGVGLVQYGAGALAEARRQFDSGYPEEALMAPPPVSVTSKKSGSKFLSWLRAAF